MLLWKGLANEIPELSHYIDLDVAKIMEYVSKGRWSRIKALAMSTTNPRVTLPLLTAFHKSLSTRGLNSSGSRSFGR
jgi:hypothetical protein